MGKEVFGPEQALVVQEGIEGDGAKAVGGLCGRLVGFS